MIDDLGGVQTVADDILVIGNGDSTEKAIDDHNAKMKQLLDRCTKRGVKLNETKLLLKQTSVPYIGHVLTSDMFLHRQVLKLIQPKSMRL